MCAPPGSARTTSSTRRFDPARTGSPNRDQSARDALDDLGLIDNDNTPDMRKAPAATEALQENHPPSYEQEF